MYYLETRHYIPTYVRNGNTDSAQLVEPINSVTNEKRLIGFPESNREGLFLDQRLSVVFLSGDLNDPDYPTKSAPSSNLLALLAQNKFKIVA